jgi:hypothetical protein
MSIAYDSGTLSGAANAAALGQLVAEKIRDNLIAHPAWDLVEEYNPGSTARHYVFKCLAASSGFENDFYFLITRNIATGKLQFGLAEGYNAGTHTLSLMSTKSASGQGDTTLKSFDSKGRQSNSTYVLANAILPGTSYTPNYHTFTPSGTTCQYQHIIYDDGMVFMPYGANVGWYYCGAYTYLGTPTNVMPIHHFGSQSDMSNPQGVTRNPLCISGNFGQWALATDNPSSPASSSFLGPGFGDPDWKDALQGNKSVCAEILISINSIQSPQGGAHSTNVIGVLIGKCKWMRWIGGQGSTYSFGDSYSINGTLWVPHTYSSGNVMLFDTGVAG